MFPGITIRVPGSISYVHNRFQHKTSQELGYVVSRPKHTRSRKTIILKWSDKTTLVTAELSDLLGYYDSNIGSSFTFTNPDTSTYTVIFSDNIKYDEIQTGAGIYEVEVVLEEI